MCIPEYHHFLNNGLESNLDSTIFRYESLTNRKLKPILDCITCYRCLTHWGRVTHICVSKLTTIGSDNGLSPDRRQAIIWTNAGILLIGPLGTNPSQIGMGIQTFSFKKMDLKVSSAKWRPFCLGLNVLTLEAWTKYGGIHHIPFSDEINC